jgi:phage minor structural protein
MQKKGQMVMIKIFNATDTDFNTAGNIIINPLYCHEVKKKSLNGWYIDVEIPIKYKEYIKADKLCVVKTKSKLNPQAFRINKNIKYTTKKIKFTAEHVMFDSRKYALLDVRPTDLNGLNGLKYINERTDKTSPFSIVSSDVENINTVYLVRKNLLEAWEIFEERWGGVFDADNWNISFKQKVGNDNGETIAYGKNMQGFEILEDWSNVCTKILPVGPNGLLLKEVYLESEVQYEVPYTKIVEFQTKLESEEQTEANLLNELKNNAEEYLKEYCIPQVSYTVESNINQKLEIGDTIKVLHPSVKIFTEVLEYEYDLILNKVISLTFGNYKRDVKAKFDSIKNNIETIKQSVSNQEITIKEQTDLINSLNKKGYVYIDENEILILDQLPKEKAKNVWRFGLGGIGFSSNGYEGPFETAITMDGKINADFIKAGTMSTARIESLADFISDTNESISTIQLQQENITSEVSKKVNETELGTKIVQNFENVKIAWNKITEFIQMMILNGNASLAILDNSKKILMSLDKTGQHFYDSSENKIGDVGVINYKNTPMIAFNLNVSQNNNKRNGLGNRKKWNILSDFLYCRNIL